MRGVRYADLGIVDYAACWALQREIFDGLVRQKTAATSRATETKGPEDGAESPQNTQTNVTPTLILCEHAHVYTLGKSGQQNNLLVDEKFLKSIEAAYFHIDRGGDVTYHGPGQLVGYPILDLERLGIGLREYVHSIEEAVIRTVGDYGIAAGRNEGAAGVWLEEADGRPLRKICAIGVRSSHYVTMHGFALNVNTALEYFAHINPCGFTDRGVTSMKQELGREVDFEGVKRCIIGHLEEDLNIKIK